MALVTRGPLAATPLLRGLVWVFASAALSCGDSLVDGTYSGTPRFTLTGSVNGASEYVDAEHPEVRLAVFWAHRRPGSNDDQFVEQPGTTLLAEYYRPFELNLFDEPGADNLLSPRPGVRFGVARLGAYQDANGNGRRDETEPLIGSSTGRALLRVPQALSSLDSPTGAALAAGWYIVSTPLNCPQPSPLPGPSPEPEPVADDECGVPLGAPCKSDAECGGGGLCIHDLYGPWPDGACVIPEPPLNGCRQRGSVLVKVPQGPFKAFWLKGCEKSADCGRVHPYQCDQQLRACMPTANVPVEMNDQEPPPSFCQGQEASSPPP